MKLAFISDIHGNAIALESVLMDIGNRNIDKIVVLGDLCFRGTEPRRSLDLLRSLNTEVIKGNADEWVVRGVKEGEVPSAANEMMNKEREWTVTQLDDEQITYLNNLPEDLNLEYNGVKIHAFHATPTSLFDVVQPFAEDEVITQSLMVNKDSDLYVYGHIHKPYIRYMIGKCIINTGSVGLPFDGLNQSSYAIVEIQGEDIQTSIVRTKYNVSHAVTLFKESSYPNKELMMKILESAKI
jgi:putative phosphoesterase